MVVTPMTPLREAFARALYHDRVCEGTDGKCLCDSNYDGGWKGFLWGADAVLEQLVQRWGVELSDIPIRLNRIVDDPANTNRVGREVGLIRRAVGDILCDLNLSGEASKDEVT